MHATTTRRRFLASGTGAALTLALPALRGAEAEAGGVLRFGVISDVHQDVMHDGTRRLAAFVDDMTRRKVDFIVQLGDFCTPIEANRGFLDTWNRFGGPRHHVLGNHDMDGGAPRERTLAFYGLESGHYAFDAKGFRFVVLDGNDPGGTTRGYARHIGPAQLAWLKRELETARHPVLVFVHQPLDDAGGIDNRDEVCAVLEAARAGGRSPVVACFSGHLHQDYARVLRGIAHVQINSASYVWLPASANREVYGPAVHQAHPHLARVAPYRDPLWVVVTLDPARGTLEIEGRSSEWVGPDPWARGVSEQDYPRDLYRPAVSERKLLLA